jgi:uroporphyrinogen III methyltransferase/synthase
MTKNEPSSPLKGKRIVVTRAREQSAGLSEVLRHLGAEVIEAPAIRIAPPVDWTSPDEAIRKLDRYDWVIFTSTNGVKFLVERMQILGRKLQLLSQSKLAAIGPATKAALESHGLHADVVPERYIAEEVFEALRRGGRLQGSRALLPRADISREALPRLLRNEGVDVHVITVYRTVPAPEDISRATELVLQGGVDIVTFTSGSTVRSFFSVIEDTEQLRGKFVPASIGPITSQVLLEHGFAPGIEAEKYTSEGLAEAIVEYYTAQLEKKSRK